MIVIIKLWVWLGNRRMGAGRRRDMNRVSVGRMVRTKEWFLAILVIWMREET